MDLEERALGLLGLATRAGRTAPGQDAVRIAALGGQACLILLAPDASEGTRKQVLRLSEKTGVPVRLAGTRESLGSRTRKALCSQVAILDRSFADRLVEMLDERETTGGPEPEGSGSRESK